MQFYLNLYYTYPKALMPQIGINAFFLPNNTKHLHFFEKMFYNLPKNSYLYTVENT